MANKSSCAEKQTESRATKLFHLPLRGRRVFSTLLVSSETNKEQKCWVKVSWLPLKVFLNLSPTQHLAARLKSQSGATFLMTIVTWRSRKKILWVEQYPKKVVVCCSKKRKYIFIVHFLWQLCEIIDKKRPRFQINSREKKVVARFSNQKGDADFPNFHPSN